MGILKLEKARVDNWTKRKFFEGTSAKLAASIDHSGLPVTGLTPADEKKFEKDLGYSPGTLKRTSDFWNDFTIIVDADGVLLDEDDIEAQLKIKFLKAQTIVAVGKKALTTNSKAEYILFSEEEEKASKNIERRTKFNAMKLATDMTEEDLKAMVLMYGHNPANMSADAIKDFVYDKVEADPKTFELLANDPAKDSKVFVQRLVKAGILETRGGAYLYNDENLGYGLEAVAIMLADKKNQELRIALEKQLIED